MEILVTKKVIVKFLYLTILFITASMPVFSQTINVLHNITGDPIENVAIYNQTRDVSTLTDSKGIADLSIFGAGDTLSFQHPAFTIKTRTMPELAGRENIYLSRKVILMDEFVISASKALENKKQVPYKIDVIDDEKIHEITSQTAAEMLESTGNVFLQKSQGGGGSPILRGFEANKVLLVIDGVRMNNAIYRGGHLQNAITIDNNILQRAEIVYGPSSVIYGSDALGGVIHYYTRNPKLSLDETPDISGNVYGQFSTVNNGKIGNVNLNVGLKNFASLTSFTSSDYGDIKMGTNRNPFLNDFGKLNHHAIRHNGQDSTVRNEDPNIQKNTGYTQYDFLQKLLYRVNSKLDLNLNIQYSTSSNVDRFDKLNDYQDEHTMKYATWHYGPQNRFMGSLRAHYKKKTPLFTSFSTLFAYQQIDEDRIKRRFGVNDKLFEKEDVEIYSLNIDFVNFSEVTRRFNYGLEFIYNKVGSHAYYENIETGERSMADATRYPDTGNHTYSFSGYGVYRLLLGEKYVLTSGMRYNYSNLFSRFSGDYLSLPFETVSISNGALTGSVSLVYRPEESWQLNFIGSTGYRNPNIDDYGKVRAKDELITLPNDKLKPEYTYNFEAGISKTFDGYIRFDGNVYMSYLTNAIVRTFWQYQGQDSLEFDNEMYRVTTNTNAEEALIRGMSLSLVSDLNSDVSFKSTLNYTHGVNLTTDEPLGHIPPWFGRTSFRYKTSRIDNEIFIMYSGWKYIEDFSPYGEDNADEATEHGYPGWYTLNLRVSYMLTEVLRLQVGIENIFDQYYKPFASGVSGPGRNFIFSLRASI